MLPLSFLSKVPVRPYQMVLRAGRPLSTSHAVASECGKPDTDKDKCQSTCDEGKKKKKQKKCDSTGYDQVRRKQFETPELPDFCSKENAMECARKIKELQKQWEAIAAAAAAQDAAKNGGHPSRPPGCKVKPPQKEPQNSHMIPLLVGLTAVVAGAIYWLLNHKKVDEEGKKEDKKEE